MHKTAHAQAQKTAKATRGQVRNPGPYHYAWKEFCEFSGWTTDSLAVLPPHLHAAWLIFLAGYDAGHIEQGSLLQGLQHHAKNALDVVRRAMTALALGFFLFGQPVQAGGNGGVEVALCASSTGMLQFVNELVNFRGGYTAELPPQQAARIAVGFERDLPSLWVEGILAAKIDERADEHSGVILHRVSGERAQLGEQRFESNVMCIDDFSFEDFHAADVASEKKGGQA
jgi:hypothetical protein